MLGITKEDYVDWKNNTTTKAIYEALRERVTERKLEMFNSAQKDVAEFNFQIGFLKGWEECLDIESLVTFEKEETEDDQDRRTEGPY